MGRYKLKNIFKVGKIENEFILSVELLEELNKQRRKDTKSFILSAEVLK